MIQTEWQAEDVIFYGSTQTYDPKYDLANDRRIAAEDLESAKQRFAYAKKMLGMANKIKAGDWMLNRREEQSRAMRAINRARQELRRATIAALAVGV